MATASSPPDNLILIVADQYSKIGVAPLRGLYPDLILHAGPGRFFRGKVGPSSRRLGVALSEVTKNGRPAAVLVAVSDEEELERLVLTYTPPFVALLDAAHDRIKKGGGVSQLSSIASTAALRRSRRSFRASWVALIGHGVAISVISLLQKTRPGAGKGLVWRGGLDPADRAFTPRVAAAAFPCPDASRLPSRPR